MTEADWDDHVSTICGTGDPRAKRLKEKVLATPDEAHYLVYDTHDWEPSETRELPKDDFKSGLGEWVVKDTKGNVVGRFATSTNGTDVLRERPLCRAARCSECDAPPQLGGIVARPPVPGRPGRAGRRQSRPRL